MIASGFHNRVLAGLLSGTAREPIDLTMFGDLIDPAESKAVLKVLALTGQRLRLERPSPPESFAKDDGFIRTWRLVPETLRTTVVWLFGDPKGAVAPQDPMALGMALAFERLRCQPHPFDFPRLERFLRTHADRLGPVACAWVDRDKDAAEQRGYFDPEVLDDTTWHEAPPARRRRYLEDRRRQEPDAARGLLEAVWSGQNGEMRTRLLQALRIGLAPADQPFLEGLVKDRSPRVRDQAGRFLSLLTGDPDQKPALGDLAGRIERGQTGLLRKRPTLRLTLPATVNQTTAIAWVRDNVADLELGPFSRAVEVAEEDLVAAANSDPHLLLAITLLATREARSEVLAQVATAQPDLPWTWLTGGAFGPLEGIEPAGRAHWAELLFDPARSKADHLVGGLPVLLQLLEGPLSEGMMTAVLHPAVWDRAAAVSPSLAGTAAALCPAACRPTLRARLGPSDPGQASPALSYLDLLDRLEEGRPS